LIKNDEVKQPESPDCPCAIITQKILIFCDIKINSFFRQIDLFRIETRPNTSDEGAYGKKTDADDQELDDL
jgi:hypothetical protein